MKVCVGQVRGGYRQYRGCEKNIEEKGEAMNLHRIHRFHSIASSSSRQHFWGRREDKSVHYHHRKKNHLENLSGLTEKLSMPAEKPKAYKNQESHIYHPFLSSVAPIFFQPRKSSSLEQGSVCFLFPSGVPDSWQKRHNGG